VASVIGTADRPDGRWAYLDVGLYHGLFESLPAAGGFVHPMEAEGRARPQTYWLGGPTCDGLDVLPMPVVLPELKRGDRVAFHLAGAYSTDLSCPFNGFPVPAEVVALAKAACA
jgi:ornithine decarboxylase